MQNRGKSHPRVFGLLTLVVGIIFTVLSIQAYREGARVLERTVMLAPLCLLYGLAVLIEPRFMVQDWRELRGNDAFHKRIGLLIAVSGFGVGLFFRYVVFKNWHLS